PELEEVKLLFISRANLWICMLLATSAAYTAEDPLRKLLQIDLKHVPVVDALKYLEVQASVKISCAPELLLGLDSVTLQAQSVPAEELFYNILNPRGLELVQSGPAEWQVVAGSTELGLLKSFGRALRTFIRLELKLEGAKQAGDEV